MAVELVAKDPLETVFRETPVCVLVVCVVVHLLLVSYQLNVWVSVFLVVDTPAAGGVERHPGLRATLLWRGRFPWFHCERDPFACCTPGHSLAQCPGLPQLLQLPGFSVGLSQTRGLF